MTEKAKIGRIVTSVILLILFVLPIAIKATHFCEKDTHNVSNEKNTSVHENSSECSICDFYFSTFVYDFLSFSELANANNFYKVITNFTSVFSDNNTKLSFFLRGPPQFLA